MSSNGRKIRQAVLLLSVAAAACSMPSLAAERYPARPIAIVAPFAPGTGTDAITRLIADHLQRAFGSPVVVENKPGAGGTIGSSVVARAQPNGYTLLLCSNTTHAVVRSLYRQVPYDPERDFTLVARVVGYGSVLVVNAAVPVNTAAEFVAYARNNPGKIRYAHGNSTGIIGGETLKQALRIDLVAVPYRSNPPALIDLLNGSIEAMIVDLQSGMPQIRARKIRPLGVLASARSSILPDVPTLSETVVPGFNVRAWGGVAAPAGTPREIVTLLETELRKFTERSDIKEKIHAMGFEPFYAGAEEFSAFMKAETARWTQMAKAAGIKPE
ncbi:MAG: tripartite tricarboxylate transporter substrate binding protein [Betaproteobacteria bacterium]|nr:tripartite tricarboxylate transporter substrate binding protein [Betaproteobacteria bacterium]